MEKISLQFREQLVKSLLQRGQSKFVQLSLEAGQALTKHRAVLALTVIVLSGKVRFTVGETTEVLDASSMLAIAPDAEHALEGIEKSTVLLVLTPDDDAAAPKSVRVESPALEHENAYQHPELLEQIAPELRVLVQDHIEVCKVLETLGSSLDLENIQSVLQLIEKELSQHFVIEEKVVFPRMAAHVGGVDVGPVARLLEEHRHIRQLHAEAVEFLSAYEQNQDEHTGSLLNNKMADLSKTLLNHLGKEDSHLFPMASRLLTVEEKVAIAVEMKQYEPSDQ